MGRLPAWCADRPNKGNTQLCLHGLYTYETVGRVERHIGGLGIGYRFGRDRNLEVTLEGNHGVAPGLNADTRALLSLRVAS